MKGKFLSFLLSGIVAFASLAGTTSFASADNNVENVLREEPRTQFDDKEGYVLISEETFTNENGVKITHKSYAKDGISTYDELERKTLRVAESTIFTLEGFDWAELWIDATFAYYPETNTCFIKKTKSSSGYRVLHSHATVVSESQDYDSNQGGFIIWGKKYAFFEQNLTLNNGAWKGQHDFRFRVEVNSEGKVKYKY